MPDTGDVVTLGISRTQRETQASVPREGGFDLLAIQRGSRREITISARDRAGILYGSYVLLEALGVLFAGLGDSSTVVPARPATWPNQLSLADAPAFSTRGFWAWEPRGSPEFFLWMARNRLNLWTAADTAYVPLMKKLGFHLTGGGHTIESQFLTPSRYFAGHPEWYGLHGGRRSPAIHGESGDNFCTGNAAARRTLAGNIVRALIDGSLARVDELELWMLDGGRWCECDSCRAQGGPTDRWLEVAGAVRLAVDSARADGRLARSVHVVAPAYLETLAPPTRTHEPAVDVTFFPYFRCYAHTLADSSCTEINRRLAAAFRGWESAGLILGAVCEYWNVGAFKTLPLVFRTRWRARHGLVRRPARRPRRLHARSHARVGCWTLDHRLFAQLAWNPHQDPDSLVARFCREYFPASAAAMREHYRQLERASANILALQHFVSVSTAPTRRAEGSRSRARACFRSRTCNRSRRS